MPGGRAATLGMPPSDRSFHCGAVRPGRRHRGLSRTSPGRLGGGPIGEATRLTSPHGNPFVCEVGDPGDTAPPGVCVSACVDKGVACPTTLVNDHGTYAAMVRSSPPVIRTLGLDSNRC